MNHSPSLKLAVLFLTLAAVSADAQTAPAPQPLKIIVPWAKGGGTQVLNDAFAIPFAKALGRPVVVETIPGNRATKGGEVAAQATPDGNTLLSVQETQHGTYHAGVTDLKYTDFEPVCMVTTTDFVFVAAEGRPWKSMKELIADAKKNPGKIKTAGTLGSSSYFIPALIAAHAGVTFTIDETIEGTAARMQAVKDGRIDIGEVHPGSQVETSKGNVLAFTGEKRHPALPNVPTLKEQGIDMTYLIYRGLLAPKGTPEAVLQKLDAACAAAAKDKPFNEVVEKYGSKVTYLPRNEYRELLKKYDEMVVGWLKKIDKLKR